MEEGTEVSRPTEAVQSANGLYKLSPRAYGPRNLMKVAGVATKWKRNVAATQALNPLLSVALSRLSTLLSTKEYDPEDEKWKFPPGWVVRVQKRRRTVGEYLLAVAP